MASPSAARSPRFLAALGATFYVAALAAAGLAPVRALWGLDPIRYASPAERALCLFLALAGLLLVWRGAATGGPNRPAAAKPPGAKRGDDAPRAWGGPAAIAAMTAASALLLWLARDRSHFLGDGRIWIEHLRAGSLSHYSEPLSVAVWQGYLSLLRVLGVEAGPDALALLSVACGLVAGLLFAQIAREIALACGTGDAVDLEGPGSRGARLAMFGLMATSGLAMLYFGYIEVYPIVSLALLAYVLVALKCLRGAIAPVFAGAFFVLAVGAHLVAAFLAPSYAYVVLRSARSAGMRTALLAAPVPIVLGLLALLGIPITETVRPFGVLSVALRSTAARALPSVASAFAVLSDFLSVLLLVLPVPLILLLASLRRDGEATGVSWRSARAFLAVAALPGILGALALVIPGSPAQDWDLMAMTVLPLLVLGVATGGTVLRTAPPPFRAGLIAISVAGVAPFVLVNASPARGLQRLAGLVGPESRASAHERAYGNEKIARTYMDRHDYASALPFALASHQAEPQNARFLTNLGQVLQELGRVDEAIPLLRRAVALAPQRWDARFDLGLCYVKRERYAEAAEVLGTAVAAGGDRPDVNHLWGIALYRSGRPDSAVAVWRGILARWPDYAQNLRTEGLAAPGGAPPRGVPSAP